MALSCRLNSEHWYFGVGRNTPLVVKVINSREVFKEKNLLAQG